MSSLPAAVYRIAAAFVVGMKIEVGQRVHEFSTGLLHKPYASPAPADDEIRPRLELMLLGSCKAATGASMSDQADVTGHDTCLLVEALH